MKNYPKSLADIAILQRILEELYSWAERFTLDADRYKQDAEENDNDEFYLNMVAESLAKSAACVRLAEKLVK